MAQKLLIIGGSSFLAQYFIRKFHANYRILAVSRARFDVPEDVEKLMVSDYFCINDMHFEGVDAVMHFAAIVHQPKTPASVYKRTNTDLPLHLAAQAKRCGAKQFIQLSSIAVFGEAEHILTPADSDPAFEAYSKIISYTQNTITPYGVSKLLADEALGKLADDTFTICSVRPPMVYGGGPAPGNMARLIKLVKMGLPLPFSANAQRHFIHVGNLAICLDLLLSQPASGIYYPTDSRGYSTGELVNIIGAQKGKRIRLFALPDFCLAWIRRCAPSLYRKLWGGLYIEPQQELMKLGYHPTYTMEEGISEML